ncbi:MAG: orotidine-5'-phosphate decarboxylase [Chloroflexota bacterium]|nr:orotidine-5'-phosphate decarboxylase [Chloroflexota bacterium]
MLSFEDRLVSKCRSQRSLLCVGLDPDPNLMAISDIFEFNKTIIDSTSDLVCAYKPNLAFYEAQGIKGLMALENTVEYIRSLNSSIIIIGDGKRGDIGSSNAKYADALFKVWGFDAATVNGYGGGETLEPFLNYKDKGTFVWCRSSNPGAPELQDVEIVQKDSTSKFFEYVSSRAQLWNSAGNLGLVAGATHPSDLVSIRNHCPSMPILIPGVGSQSGDLESSVRLGKSFPEPKLIITASRSIIYASSNRSDFSVKSRSAAFKLRDDINKILAAENIWV